MPVICSPTGVQAVDPAGEVGVARGAAMSGTALGLSSFGSKPVEEVVAANDKTFFQIYWLGSKDDMAARLDRAREAGAKGIIVTLDWVFATARDWGSPPLPEKIDLKTAVRFAPEVRDQTRLAAAFRPFGETARSDHSESGRTRAAGADLLRRLR